LNSQPGTLNPEICTLNPLQTWGSEPSVALTAPAFSSTGASLVYLGEGSNALVPGATYVLTSVNPTH